jgi:phospholipid/cholesterol/gamma-HCH transport system substrate-binding protein
MRRKLDTELKAGIFIFIGLVILVVGVMLIGSERSLFAKSYPIYVEVSDVMGLAKGAMVRSGGIKVGRIGEITFADNSDLVRVQLLINQEFQKRVRSDSVVRLQTQGVLGDKFIEIFGGTQESPPLEANGLIRAEQAKDLSTVLASSQDVVLLLKENLENIKQITSAFSNGNRSDVFFRDMTEMASNMKELTKQMKSGGGELNATLKNLNAVTTKVKNGEGTIGALLSDATLYEDLKNLIGGANRNKVLKFFVRQAVKSSDESNKDKEEKK